MKKFINSFIILIALFIPFMVNAEECNPSNIKIKDIDIKDKSEYVEELSDTTFKDNKINLDLKMYDVGDYIEYELKVKNESNEDYYINRDSLDVNSDYFEYSITFSDNSNKIEPNTEKTIYLRVEYKNEVEKDKFLSGKYVSNNMVTLKSSTNNIITNPLTKNNKLTIFLFILLVIQLVLYFTRSKRINKTMILLIGILLPFEVFALCNFELDINSNITIGKVKPNPCTYDGELVQGAEYVNGQYTYKYKVNYWGRVIEEDGWSVVLTDMNSQEPVTTKLCTSINNKPIVSMNAMFFGSKATAIDLSSFDTSNVIDMRNMFHSAVNVDKYDLSNFDTTKVKDIAQMFFKNEKIKELDLRYFNTSNMIDMNSLFYYDDKLEKINMDNWDLTASTNGSGIIANMFYGTNSLNNISLKNWKIPETFTNALGCRTTALCSTNLESIDVTGWDLRKTKDIFGLFGNLNAKEIKGLNTWNTSNIENMSNIFGVIQLQELDISDWDTSNVTNMSAMFYFSSNLKTIIISDKFKTGKVTYSSSMFEGCDNILGENGTVYDSNHIDKEYARIDTSEAPGYFTKK